MNRKRVNLKTGHANCPVSATLFFSSDKLEKIKLEESSSFSLFFDGACSQEGAVIEWFEAFLYGLHLPFPLELELDTPPFHLKVLEALKEIPFGEFKSYKEIAITIGQPKGARAVGNACNRNPFPLVIPCHRVTMSGGKLGGFAYGCGIKEDLLNFESQATSYREEFLEESQEAPQPYADSLHCLS